MIIEALYKHEEPGLVAYQKRRQSQEDELFARFIPEDGETNPFPDTLIAVSQIAQWAQEYAQMEESLNTVGVQTQEENDAE